MKRAYSGSRIFNVVSMAGMATGGVGLGSYGPSKHAAQCFSVTLRYELAAFGIQVSTINPSFHSTQLVTGMHDEADRTWAKVSKEKREEYGEGRFVSAKAAL